MRGLFAVHDYRLSGAIVWDDPNYRLGRGECVTPPRTVLEQLGVTATAKPGLVGQVS